MILQKIVPKFYKNESKVCPTFYFLQPILQNMIKIAPGMGGGRIKMLKRGGKGRTQIAPGGKKGEDKDSSRGKDKDNLRGEGGG